MRSRKYDREFTGINIRQLDGDKDVIDSFFLRRREVKRADFYRDAILEKIEREEAIEREREAIRSGRTQIDMSRLAGARS